MVKYFALLPAAAVKRQHDGNLYAYVAHRVTADGVRECEPRMVRANDCAIANGVARVYIGCMGDAIAQTNCLPFGVAFERE